MHGIFSPNELNVQKLGWSSLYFTSADREYGNVVNVVLCSAIPRSSPVCSPRNPEVIGKRCFFNV